MRYYRHKGGGQRAYGTRFKLGRLGERLTGIRIEYETVLC